MALPSTLYASIVKFESRIDGYAAELDPLRAEAAKLAPNDPTTPALLRAIDEELGRLDQELRRAKRDAATTAVSGVRDVSPAKVTRRLTPVVFLTYRIERLLQSLRRELKTMADDDQRWARMAEKVNRGGEAPKPKSRAPRKR